VSILIGREQSGYGGVVTWSENGNDISATLDYAAPTLAAIKVIRQKLAGYAGNVSERIVPVIDDDDPDRSGWYMVTGVTLVTAVETYTGYQLKGVGLTMTKVAGYQSAIVEQIAAGTYRTGIPVGIIAVPWLAWPLSWTGIDPTYTAAPGAFDVRAVTASLDVGSYVDGANFDCTYLSEAPLESFYDAAATFESNGEVIVGTQFVDDPTDWLLSNGLMELRTPADPDDLFDCRWRNAAGSAWSGWYGVTAATFPLGVYTQYSAQNVRAVPLLRNSPEEVTVRLAVPAGPNDPGTLYVTVSLRRGSRYATALLESNIEARWGVAWSSATASSYITAHHVGIAETADNADGNRNLFVTGQPASVSLGSGRIGLASGYDDTWFDVGIGSEVGGGAAAAIDTAVYEQSRYFAAVSERANVIPQ
jgi:hypothetical protein